MIVLYKSTEKDFMHNGIGILKDCIKAEIREELNGNFTLDLEYPLESEISSFLIRGNIIKCPVGDGRENQLFRIRRSLKNTRTIIIYAEHIVIADLATNFIVDTNIVGKTRVEALQQILNVALEKHRFYATGDSGGKQDILRIVRYSTLRAIIGTDENTLINRYGGEIEYNNFNIKVLNQRGNDNGILISYGKNITGIEESLDDSELITSIIPEGQNGLLLPEYKIDSPYLNNYEKVFFKKVDIGVGVVEKSEDNVGVTREEALQKMRDAVALMYSKEHVDLINANYRINFISLAKTEEYKNYSVLENVAMGDTVTIKHTKLGLDLKARVFKTIYNVLRDKLEEIELGFSKKTLSNIIQDTVKQIQFTKEKIELGISNLDNTLSAKITITENGINENIKNTKAGLEANITKTAVTLKSEYTNLNNQTNSVLTQTSNSIRTQVNNLRDDTHTQINQLEDSISLKANRRDLISEINICPESIVISSDRLDLNGLVTFHNLRDGSTTISGDNIRTGSISCNLLDGGTIRGQHIEGGQIDGSELDVGDIDCQQLTVRGSARLRQDLVVKDDIYSSGNIGARHNIACEGNLDVTGNKNCLQQTQSYGKRAITAYETAESYFGDLGYGVIGADGICKIDIDPIMLECFNTKFHYHVFTQVYNGKPIDKIDRFEKYFVVYGEPKTDFSYEIKAKRLGFENIRLIERK